MARPGAGSNWLVSTIALLLTTAPAWAAEPLDPQVAEGTIVIDDTEVGFRKQGTLVPDACDYDWWYGCSPTSAGMMIGHYDRYGYGGAAYDNLVPGGVAELETFVGPPTGGSAFVCNAIASPGNVQDFYVGGYLALGDDRATPPPYHTFDCLADFMGTSQDACGNSNGSTTFYYFVNGSPFTPADAEYYGVDEEDGMHGIGEYVEYCGYDAKILFTQLCYPNLGYPGNSQGFTFANFKVEIDAGRPVIIQVEGHSMCGVGYLDDGTSTIYVYDTWNTGPHTMTWAGSYSGLNQWGVVVFEPIPEPATLALFALGALGLAARRRGARPTSPR